MPAPLTSQSPVPAEAADAAPRRRESLLMRLYRRLDENLAEV